MSGKLEGRVAIVTGGGRGIGRATAELFAAEGARVVVATRTAAPGEATVAAITKAGGEATLFVVDIGSREAVRDLVIRTIERYGALDIVLHNAAYIPYGKLGRLTDAELDKTFDVGLKAAFWLAADALPHLMASRAARILVTSSVAGNREVTPGLVHYGAMKAGLNGFIRGAALELAPRRITVNGIEPGLTMTHSLQVAAKPDQIRQMEAGIPLGRAAEPREIATAFLYLASDEAAYITGQTLVIDGGSMLGKPAGLPIDAA